MAQFYKDIHEEVQQYFPGFHYLQPSPPSMRDVYCDMSKPGNQVGHQQRAFTCYYAVQFCNPLDLGLDLGSTRGLTPYCIHVDKWANGRPNPLYVGHDPVWADVLADMADLSMFSDNCFPLVTSNHSLEHADVARYLSPEVPRYPYPPPYDGLGQDREAFAWWKDKHWNAWKEGTLKEWIANYPQWQQAYDDGVVQMLREQWIRVLRPPMERYRREPGGLLVMCIPDSAYFDVFNADSDHKHVWSAEDFKPRILDKLLDLIEVLEYNTLHNNFSFNVVARKK